MGYASLCMAHASPTLLRESHLSGDYHGLVTIAALLCTDSITDSHYVFPKPLIQRLCFPRPLLPQPCFRSYGAHVGCDHVLAGRLI